MMMKEMVVMTLFALCRCRFTDDGDVDSGDDDNHVVQVLNTQTHDDDDESDGGHDNVHIVQSAESQIMMLTVLLMIIMLCRCGTSGATNGNDDGER